MPLEPIGKLMENAYRNGYGIGYFESWNLESLQGVIDAGEQTKSPIIVGFNGEFLCHPDRCAEERLAWYGALGQAAAESAAIPCGLLFNECPNDEWVMRAVTSGFNLVMPADSDATYDKYLHRVRKITRYAHEHGVGVEAEIDELPCGIDNDARDGDSAARDSVTTDPELAARFVEATGVDLLAVSVGNVHIKIEGEQGLDLDRLARIRDRVGIPLVLHGGTGIRADSLREAVTMGVAKVNYGTYLKQRYLAAVRAAVGKDQRNPHRLFGMGGSEDVMVIGRHAVRDAVLERIHLLGCCGRG